MQFIWLKLNLSWKIWTLVTEKASCTRVAHFTFWQLIAVNKPWKLLQLEKEPSLSSYFFSPLRKLSICLRRINKPFQSWNTKTLQKLLETRIWPENQIKAHRKFETWWSLTYESGGKELYGGVRGRALGVEGLQHVVREGQCRDGVSCKNILLKEMF